MRADEFFFLGWVGRRRGACERGRTLEPSAGILPGVLGALFSSLWPPWASDKKLFLYGSGRPRPGQGRARGREILGPAGRQASLSGKVADMTLTCWVGGLCPCLVSPTIAVTWRPVRSPGPPMPTALWCGAWGLGCTEVSIVPGWQLGLTCWAEEVGPWG